MSEKYTGKCTSCGKETELVIVDEVNHLCQECLDEDYFYCEECNQYWHSDYVENYELSDGRTVCEHCYEDTDEENPELKKLIHEISENEELSKNIYNATGIYFIVTNDDIYTISDDASCSPKGGWFPEIVKGPTEEESKEMKKLMDDLGFDEYFLDDMIDSCGEFDDDSALEYYEEEEDIDNLNIYKAIQEKVKSGNTVFESMNNFANVLRRYGLDSDMLYYEWEGEWIEFYDNIYSTGESRGYYDSLSDDEWIDILNNLEDYKVEG